MNEQIEMVFEEEQEDDVPAHIPDDAYLLYLWLQLPS